MNSPGGPALITWERINGKQGPQFWGRDTPLGDHKWHKIEIYVSARPTPTGNSRVWIDGNLRLQVTNAITVAEGRTWGPLFLTSNWTSNPGWEHGENNHLYWDDVEIYSDNGADATGNMSDATVTVSAPVPQQGVRVQK